MQLHTWGNGGMAHLKQEFDPKRHVFLNRVCTHLGLELVEISGGGGPTLIAIGRPAPVGEDAIFNLRASPFFSSLTSLDYFCQRMLDEYLAVDPGEPPPRHWFWEQPRAGRALYRASVGVGARARWN